LKITGTTQESTKRKTEIPLKIIGTDWRGSQDAGTVLLLNLGTGYIGCVLCSLCENSFSCTCCYSSKKKMNKNSIESSQCNPFALLMYANSKIKEQKMSKNIDL
jgi:hypothetical protein